MSDPVHGLNPDDPRLFQRSWEYGVPRHGEHFRRCSYCGSIAPDDLVSEIVRGRSDGGALRPEWADMKYGWPHKLYVSIPNREPETVYALGATTRLGDDDERHVPTARLTEEQRTAVERSWGEGWQAHYEGFYFGHRDEHYGKFYTVHLADPDLDPAVKEFIETWSGRSFSFNDGRVSWHNNA